MASYGPSHLDVFIRGSDHTLYHRAYTTSWTGWVALDGLKARYDPVVITRPANDKTIDVFAVDFEHALYHRMWKASKNWGPWTKIATGCIGPPAVVSRDKNKFLELAYVASDHALKHKRLEENQQWVPAGTDTFDWGGQYIYGRGSACSWGTDHVSFFNIGLDSKCYEKKWMKGTGGWNDFEVPGVWTTPPRSIALDVNTIKLVGLNEKNMAQFCASRPENKWELEHTFPRGVFAPEIPEAVSFDPKNRVDFFFLGMQSALYQLTWTKAGGYKESLVSLGGNFQYAPRVVSWGPGRYDMFGIGTDSALKHLWTSDGDNWKFGFNNFENMQGTCMGTPGGQV